MRLHLHFSDGCGSPCPLVLEVGQEDEFTVAQLRKAVAARLSVSTKVKRIHMMLHGKVLDEEDQTLAAAGVRDSADLILALWEPFGCGETEIDLGAGERGIPSMETLASVFNLSSFPVSKLQSPPGADMLSLFTKFVKVLTLSCSLKVLDVEERSAPPAEMNDLAAWKCSYRKRDSKQLRTLLVPVIPTFEQIGAMKYAADALANTSLSKYMPLVTWFPAYGCCIIANHFRTESVAIELVGLDVWKFKVHGFDNEHSADASEAGSSSLFSDLVCPEDYQRLLTEIDARLRESEDHKGSKRSAGHNKNGGHQKTPAFVYITLRKAIKAIKGQLGNLDVHDEEEVSLQGGMTDVGLHTGCIPRNTTWPLLCAVIHRCLEARGCVNFFHMAMASFKFWVAESFAIQLHPELADRVHVDVAMDLLRSAVESATAAVDSGLCLRAFEIRCALIRKTIETAVGGLCADVASKFAISNSDVELNQSASCQNFRFKTPEAVNTFLPRKDMRDIRSLAAKNIGQLPILDPRSSWTDLLDWFQRSEFNSNAKVENVVLSLRTVESYCMHHASALRSSPGTSKLSKADIATLENLVDEYRVRATAFRESRTGALLRVSELLSLEVLSVWICSCLVHQAVALYHPTLCKYRMPISYKSLRYLVLSEQVAIDAAYNVSFYLRDEGKQELFSLQPHSDPTFDFAVEVARTQSRIKEVLASERVEMERRESKHWQLIMKKKEHLTSLRGRLVDLRDQLSSKNDILSRETQFYSKRHRNGSSSMYTRTEWTAARDECSKVESEIASVESNIETTERPPPNVQHPLPESDELAFLVLFFMFMPSELNTLARLCVASQNLLLPRCNHFSVVGENEKVDIDQLVCTGKARTSWHEYYNAKSINRSGPETHLSLHSTAEPPRERLGPRTVSAYSSAKDGVFSPCSMAQGTLRTIWHGGSFALDVRSSSAYSPFQSSQIYQKVVGNYFTENLSQRDSALQWAMPQLGFDLTSEKRGNEALSKQSMRPDWLHKDAFLEFGSMRADGIDAKQLRLIEYYDSLSWADDELSRT